MLNDYYVYVEEEFANQATNPAPSNAPQLTFAYIDLNWFRPGVRFRLGGLVEQGSVKRGDGAHVEFKVTDTLKAIPVRYEGVLPDLFREGQGVVTEGVLKPDGQFEADTVLAKHDESYMPPEVAKALQAKGVKLGQGAEHPTGASN